jgi:signal transduction histidine kinase
MATPIDPRVLSLITHDLRNPLNVIGLSLRMIEEEVPSAALDIRNDLDILRQNVALLTRMLNFVSDFARQLDENGNCAPGALDPRRLIADAAEEGDAASATLSKALPIEIDIAPSCPEVVHLDAGRARVAMRNALFNALNAAAGSPVRIKARGEGNRLHIEISVAKPPRQTVASRDLRGDAFERILGTETERLGLDLAIAARASELMGGTARLEVSPGQGSAIIFDWPFGRNHR